MDAAEGEAAFRPSEACAPSRKDAGRSGKRWRKRSCALIEPRSLQSPRRAPPSPALLCFRGFLPRSSAVGGGIRPSSRATWPLLPMRDLAMAGGTGEAAGFADGNAPCVRAPLTLPSPCFARFARPSAPCVRAPLTLPSPCFARFARQNAPCIRTPSALTLHAAEPFAAVRACAPYGV